MGPPAECRVHKVVVVSFHYEAIFFMALANSCSLANNSCAKHNSCDLSQFMSQSDNSLRPIRGGVLRDEVCKGFCEVVADILDLTFPSFDFCHIGAVWTDIDV